jgi:hypothetical protein
MEIGGHAKGGFTKEDTLLLNVSPLTLSRWTLAGRIKSEKVGRKHAFRKIDLMKMQ